MPKLSFQWDIKNFDGCDLVHREFCESPRFFAIDPSFDSDWKLRLYPTGSDVLNGKKQEKLSLQLLRLDYGRIFNIKFSISFLNKIGRKIEIVKHSNLSPTSIFMYTDGYASLEAESTLEIFNYTDKFMDDGVLSILCEIEMFERHDGIALMVDKRFHMHGTSAVIKNVHKSISVEVNRENNFYNSFDLPYGNITLKLIIWFDEYKRDSFIQIIDRNHLEIKVCRVSVCQGGDITFVSAKRSEETSIPFPFSAFQTRYELTGRCLVENLKDAYSCKPFRIITCIQKIQDKFRYKFSHPLFGDISINVDGQTLRAHKDVLGCHSTVFAAMFRKGSDQEILTIKDFCFRTILVMIEFIYFGGSDEDQDVAEQTELLKAANKYQLVVLKRKCQEWLRNNMSKSAVPYLQEKRTNYRIKFFEPHFGDISIEVNGTILRIHKDILACYSPVFETIFRETWSAKDKNPIKIIGFEIETILAMIEYIYSDGSDDFPEVTDVIQLLEAADMYQLDLLKRKCEQWLCNSLRINNVESRLALSDTYDLPHLKNGALSIRNGNNSKNYN